MADECLNWISRRHAQPQNDWRAQLQMIKNTAYALRQAILFMSFCEAPTQRQIATKWTDTLGQDDRLSALRPVCQGVLHIVDGGTFNAEGRPSDGSLGRRFLGWSVGRHWLLPEASATARN
jgi:hypothetical protein